jgi:RimJ/RimL family protein N-acetyltransferase
MEGRDSFGYRGTRVRLVPPDADLHLENCYRWLNDPQVTEFMLVGYHPMTRANERDFFERIGTRETDISFAIETLDGRHIGMSGIHQIDLRHGTCVTGSFLGDRSAWGHGYGTEAARVRARYIFDVLGLRLIMTAALEGNERSLRMSRALGFHEYGFLPRRFWKNGAWRGEHLLALEREAFLEG